MKRSKTIDKVTSDDESRTLRYAQKIADKWYGKGAKRVGTVSMLSLSKARITFFDHTSDEVEGKLAYRIADKIVEDQEIARQCPS